MNVSPGSPRRRAPERYIDRVIIGRGGVGDVMRATDVETGRSVAIKVLGDLSDSSTAWHRIRRECTALVALSGHRHVVQLVELTEIGGAPAIVMEYAPYGSVGRFVDAPGDSLTRSATLPEIVLIARHAAAALAVAHEHAIIHRDVKPHNLLIGDDGRIMLCDFGVAALTRTVHYRTRTDALSMRYASPEDLDDEADVSTATDLYSLGATLLHLAHGQPPTLKERLAPWVPPDAGGAPERVLDGIIARCLHPDAAQRPTAVEVLADLERLDWSLDDRIIALDVADWSPLEPLTVELDDPAPSGLPLRPVDDATLARPPREPPHRPSPPAPTARRTWWLIAVVAVVGVAAGALGWWLDRGRQESTLTTAWGPTTSVDASTPTAIADPEGRADDAGTPSRRSIVARPSGLVDVREVVWPFGRLGECLVQTAAAELIPVSCEQPHDLQRIAIAELDGAPFGDDAIFDAKLVEAELQRRCDRALEAFVGAPGADGSGSSAFTSKFSSAFTRPSADTWAAGDRSFQCLVGVFGGRTVGDAALGSDAPTR